MKKIKLLFSTMLMFLGFQSNAQLIIDQTQTPAQLVEDVLLGAGVTASNITFNYSVPAAGALQVSVGYFDATTIPFPIPEGIILGTGNVNIAPGPNNTGSSSGLYTVNLVPDDPDLSMIASGGMQNECILEFDFVPDGDSVSFNYIFASEEYPEYSPSSFNDAFGIFLSGPGITGPFSGGGINIAQLPTTPPIPVTINNVNPTTNAAYYISNPPGSPHLQYDGHTVMLTARAQVICGETYHIKFAISDVFDGAFDSAVFLEASSFASNGVQVHIASATGSGAITEGCDSAIVTFTRPPDDVDDALTITYDVDGTATNGVDYPFLDGSITFPPGVSTVQFYVVPTADGIVEGTETVELSVSIVNACGDTIVTTATIEIVDPIPFNVVASDVLIDCPTDIVTLTASTDGGIPAFEYLWNGTTTTETFDVPGLATGSVDYTVQITDLCGAFATETITVTVAPAPEPDIVFNASTFIACPGEAVLIEAVNILNPYSTPVTYDWTATLPGTTLPGGTNSSVTVNPTVDDWYYLTINDGCYDVVDSVKIDMGTATLDDIIVVNAQDCPGQPFPILGEISILPNDASWTYTLTGGGTVYGPQASGNFTDLTGNITYILNVVNDDGCTVDTTIYVAMGTNPVVANFTPGQDVTCFGDQDGSAAISNITGGINGPPTGPYDVSWTHLSGAFSQQTGLGIGAGSSSDTLWGGTWVVTVIEQVSGCAWSQLFTIDEPSQLILNLANSSEPSCFDYNDGDINVQLSGGNPSYTTVITNAAGTILNPAGNLTVNNLTTGTYTVNTTDSKGCSANQTIFLDQPGQLDIDFTLINPSCYGENAGFIQIDAVYNYQGPFNQINYFWSPNPAGNNGTDGYINNQLAPGTVMLQIGDSATCTRNFTFTIEWPDSLYFNELGFFHSVCRNQIPFDNGQGQVYAAAAGGGNGTAGTNYNYTWTEVATGATTTNSTWGNRNPGYYTVTAYNDLGCVITETIYLDSLSPIAAFDLTSPDFTSPYTGTAVVNITLENLSENYAFSEDPNADTTFIWTFGIEGETPYITSDINEILNYSYTSAGIYEICLVVIENLNGCQDTACQSIEVFDAPFLIVPNVFSPDGDGVNDVFFFPNQAIEEFSATIFDRWGKEIFVFSSIDDGWDGSNYKNGKPCTDGVYFFTYTARSTNGTEYEGQGNIHLVRGN